MELYFREKLINRICSGQIILKLGRRRYWVKPLSARLRYLACEIYDQAYEDGINAGLMNDNQLLEFLVINNFWNIEQENKLNELNNSTEDLKTKLCQLTFRSVEKEAVRKVLNHQKQETEQLLSQKHQYDFLSARGYAQLTKSRFMLAVSLFNKQGRVFKKFWTAYPDILDQIIIIYTKQRITESQFRELARTEPWRGIYYCKKANLNIFAKPAIELSEEQKNLLVWSSIYDNVYESPDCPNEEVINDDDALDGWFILQKRKRDVELNRRSGEQMLTNNKRINGADEVYLVANTPEDAKKIYAMNDTTGRVTTKQLFKTIETQGMVSDLDRPDTRQKLQMAVNQFTRDKMKKR